MRFEPGPGMGGHCLPVDPFYLSWRAREFDMSTEFIELAGKINQQMPYHCVAKLQRTLNDRGRAVRGSRIAVLGVSYKPNVGDIRESPALKIDRAARASSAPRSSTTTPTSPELEAYGLRSAPLEDALDGADLVLIVTAHGGHRLRRDRGARGVRPGPARRRRHVRDSAGRAAVSLRADPRAPGLHVGEGVSIGEDVAIGAHVTIHDGTVVGPGCVIEDGVVLGKRPRLARHFERAARRARRACGSAARVTVCAGAVVFAGARVSTTA